MGGIVRSATTKRRHLQASLHVIGCKSIAHQIIPSDLSGGFQSALIETVVDRLATLKQMIQGRLLLAGGQIEKLLEDVPKYIDERCPLEREWSGRVDKLAC